MGYIDDYENNKQSKIPYDDTPISRTEEESYNNHKRKSSKTISAHSRLFVLFLAISLVINICLCITTVYYILNGVRKTVNQNQNQITINGDYSPIVAATAMQSAVRVAAGGTGVKDESTYYKNTLSHGAGVIYKIDREQKVAYIITCLHVIEGYEKQVYVMLPNSLKPLTPGTFGASGLSTLGYSTNHDIAVLQYKYSSENDPIEDCNGLFDNVAEPQYSESYYLAHGETVFAVGDPLSGGVSITSGIISRLNISLKVENNNYYTREIQFSAETNPGNSGGGLFNNKGEFIGLVNAKLQTAKPGGTTITVAGMAYAIPGTLAIGIAKSIIEESSHKAVCINLGVDFVHDVDAQIDQYLIDGKYVEKYGVVVGNVSSGIASSATGLRNGDIIHSITYTDRSGVIHKDDNKVLMLNKYVFEDISFDIKYGTDIIFEISRPSSALDTDPEEMIITIKATATATVN